MPTTSRATPSVTRRRRIRVGLAALAALGICYGAALALLSRPAVMTALRAKIEATLRARLGEVELGPEVRVDPALRVSFGPVAVPADRPGARPVVRIDVVKVRPDLLALLAGRIEPASIRLFGVRVEAGPGGHALKELLQRIARRAPRRATPPATAAPAPGERAADAEETVGADPAIHVRGLVLALPVGGRAVEWGPMDATLRRERETAGARVRVDLRVPGGGFGDVDARRGPGGWSATARLGGIGPAAVPAALRDGPVRLEAGVLAIEATVEGTAELDRAEGHTRLVAEGVALEGERVGSAPLGPVSATVEASLAWDGEDRRLTARGGRAVLLGAVQVGFEGEIRLGPGLPFQIALRSDRLDLAPALAALPPALAPPPDAPRPAGTLDARLALAGPLLAPAAWTVDAGLDLSRLRDAARRAPPVPLRGPFVHRPEVERGAARPITLGPSNPDFVPLAELPPYVVRAVTTAEDAGFYGHEGFDFEELKNAFAQGARAGRVVRGGSTITQQLAKNLWLSREKTLARKVREAVLTIALEATVPKSRLLEIYLNVAEWGPGLWGIGPAARHWFGKDARALTPREAVFLASVIPNPVRYHVLWERGDTTEAWDQRVNELLLKMSEQGALPEDAFLSALDERLVFARPAAAVATP
jgi:penicillin-binding protein 1A